MNVSVVLSWEGITLEVINLPRAEALAYVNTVKKLGYESEEGDIYSFASVHVKYGDQIKILLIKEG